MVSRFKTKGFRLSEFFDSSQILRDAEFDCIGLLTNFPKRRMLSYVENKKYISVAMNNKNVCALICKKELAELIKVNDLGIAISEDPRQVFIQIHNRLCTDNRYTGQEFETVIGKNCRIHNSALIAPKNVIIGENTIIEEYVSIKEGVKIGCDCIIRAGSVIGGSGFEFKRNEDTVIPVKHAGHVYIGDAVEIQQLCNISKAVFPWDATIIGEHTKLDSLVHIAHASKIGKRSMLASGVNVAGSCEIGDDVWIGVNATISSQIKIGDGGSVSLGSVVVNNIKPNTKVTGNFAIDHRKFLMSYFKQLRESK